MENSFTDLAAIMNNQKAQEAKAEEELASAEAPVIPDDQPTKSPLEMAKEKQAKGYGMEIREDEFKVEQTKYEYGTAEMEEREVDAEKALAEKDQMILNRQALVLVKRATTPQEWAIMEDEIAALQFDENGKPYFDYTTETIDGETKELTPEFFVIRTPEYGPYDRETEAYYSLGKTPAQVKRLLAMKEEGQEIPSAEEIEKGKDLPEDVERELETVQDSSDTKKELVKVLIDKTGYGKEHIDFTKEERAKLTYADQIIVSAVKKLDLSSIQVNSTNPDIPTTGFQKEVVNKQISSATVSVTFPNSGFYAEMKGLGYGEIMDLSVNPEYINTSVLMRQASIVYNNMVNLSREPFKDFNDFLNNFAYADFSMALYGLFAATYPEIQNISMTCQAEDCKAAFEHTYRVREILRFEECAEGWLKDFRNIINASPSEYKDLPSKSKIGQHLAIELPDSKFIVQLGHMTLNKYINDYMYYAEDEDRTKELMGGDNISNAKAVAFTTAYFIDSVLVPSASGDGTYEKYTQFDKIIKVLTETNVSYNDMRVVIAIINENFYVDEAKFAMVNVKCPACGRVTKLVPLNIQDLVFLQADHQWNTNIDVENLQLM